MRRALRPKSAYAQWDAERKLAKQRGVLCSIAVVDVPIYDQGALRPTSMLGLGSYANPRARGAKASGRPDGATTRTLCERHIGQPPFDGKPSSSALVRLGATSKMDREPSHPSMAGPRDFIVNNSCKSTVFARLRFGRYALGVVAGTFVQFSSLHSRRERGPPGTHFFAYISAMLLQLE